MRQGQSGHGNPVQGIPHSGERARATRDGDLIVRAGITSSRSMTSSLLRIVPPCRARYSRMPRPPADAGRRLRTTGTPLHVEDRAGWGSGLGCRPARSTVVGAPPATDLVPGTRHRAGGPYDGRRCSGGDSAPPSRSSGRPAHAQRLRRSRSVFLIPEPPQSGWLAKGSTSRPAGRRSSLWAEAARCHQMIAAAFFSGLAVHAVTGDGCGFRRRHGDCIC